MAKMAELWAPNRQERVYLLATKHGASRITSGGLSSILSVERYLLESI